MHTRRAEPLTIQRYVVVGVVQQFSQSPQLDGRQLVARSPLDRLERIAVDEVRRRELDGGGHCRPKVARRGRRTQKKGPTTSAPLTPPSSRDLSGSREPRVVLHPVRVRREEEYEAAIRELRQESLRTRLLHRRAAFAA